MRLVTRQLRIVKRDENGFTLLEYVAGAAVLIGVVWGAMSLMGGSMRDVMLAIQTWLSGRAQEINEGNGSANS